MTFVKKSANLTPIVDNVFSIVSLAKKDKLENGTKNVVDATIGSLYGEDEQLVALDEVFNHYDAIDHRTKAAYASSFTGNPDYREAVWNWVKQDEKIELPHSVIATPGGSGAVSMSIETFLDSNETLIIPDIAWGNYALMASNNNIQVKKYKMFDEEHFNITSFKNTVLEVSKTQERICIIINDPCHNPTGYSMSEEEWKEVIDFLNEVSKNNSVILIDDIAYIDYSYNLLISRKYMNTFNHISDNVMLVVAFSCSKALTSYGLRCGAAVVISTNKDSVREAEIYMEKKARATWSNIPNAAMSNFVWITSEGKDAFLKEKQKYIDLMKERSSIFLSEANEVGLECYPYKEGFFITLKMKDNDYRDTFHKECMKEHIYTVSVNQGIRVAVCSLPVNKVYGLAKKMKEIQEKIK